MLRRAWAVIESFRAPAVVPVPPIYSIYLRNPRVFASWGKSFTPMRFWEGTAKSCFPYRPLCGRWFDSPDPGRTAPGGRFQQGQLLLEDQTPGCSLYSAINCDLFFYIG